MAAQTCPWCGSSNITFKTLARTWQESQSKDIVVQVLLWFLALSTGFLSLIVPAARPWNKTVVTFRGRQTEWLCKNCGERGWLEG
jgi:predicted RNA-binding Zn-ribbon protein involved in translation (DUF1610 family)